ncbi:MAG: hypothetical protein MR616_03990 [Pyramidobacter sp.]|nr:hypothetical protein [Pyramidobacter sp.]
MVAGIEYRPFPEYKLSISFHEKQSKRFFMKATAEKTPTPKQNSSPAVEAGLTLNIQAGLTLNIQAVLFSPQVYDGQGLPQGSQQFYHRIQLGVGRAFFHSGNAISFSAPRWVQFEAQFV